MTHKYDIRIAEKPIDSVAEDGQRVLTYDIPNLAYPNPVHIGMISS